LDASIFVASKIEEVVSRERDKVEVENNAAEVEKAKCLKIQEEVT
jgi:hypothetical protein